MGNGKFILKNTTFSPFENLASNHSLFTQNLQTLEFEQHDIDLMTVFENCKKECPDLQPTGSTIQYCDHAFEIRDGSCSFKHGEFLFNDDLGRCFRSCELTNTCKEQEIHMRRTPPFHYQMEMPNKEVS